MPHGLDRLTEGTGAMFSVGDTPWHREGSILVGARCASTHGAYFLKGCTPTSPVWSAPTPPEWMPVPCR